MAPDVSFTIRRYKIYNTAGLYVYSAHADYLDYDEELDETNNSRASGLYVITDDDGNAIDDGWEALYFTAGTVVDPDGDPDLDAYTTFQEWLADTDPTQTNWTTVNGCEAHAGSGGTNTLTDTSDPAKACYRLNVRLIP